MGILQKADRCMDEAAALFGENKLFLAEKKAQETASLYKSCGAYEQMAKTVNLMGVIYASIGDCKHVDRLLLRGYGCSCGAGLNRDNNAC